MNSISSRNLVPIEWYHIHPIPHVWYQFGISFNQFHICDTNWMVSVLNQFHISPVPDISYQLNDITSYHSKTCDTNWIWWYWSCSRHMMAFEWFQFQPVSDVWYNIEWYQILPFPDIWITSWTVSFLISSRHLIPFKWYQF